MLEGLTCVYRSNVDLFFYVVGSSAENELILVSVLNCLYDAVSQILRLVPACQDYSNTAPLSKKRSMCISGNMQTTFFYLGRFLKKLADDQCCSITIGSMYHMKHMSIQAFTVGVD